MLLPVIDFVKNKRARSAKLMLGKSIASKVEGDISALMRMSLLNSILAVVLPLSLATVAYYFISTYTQIDEKLIILLISIISLFAVILLILHNKRQLSKRVDDYSKIVSLAKAPAEDFKVFANPFIRELIIEHKKMKQSKEIS